MIFAGCDLCHNFAICITDAGGFTYKAVFLCAGKNDLGCCVCGDLDINIEGDELPVVEHEEDTAEEFPDEEEEELDIDELDFKGLGDLLGSEDVMESEEEDDGGMDFLADILSSDLDDVFSGDDLDE